MTTSSFVAADRFKTHADTFRSRRIAERTQDVDGSSVGGASSAAQEKCGKIAAQFRFTLRLNL
jgi:hypothetical protein